MTDPLATGLQIAAGTAAKAIKSDNQDAQAIRQAASGSGALERAATVYGRRMAVRQEVILKLWQPLARFFGVSREYFEQDFAVDLAEKLEGVPEAELQSPKAVIAGPAIEGLGYSLDEPDLKEMYLNLLARASVQTTAPSVHPSFVDVIRQLSPEEAPLLSSLLATLRVPAIRIKRTQHPQEGFSVVAEHVIALGNDLEVPKWDARVPSWVENWQRLGLVHVAYTEYITDNAANMYWPYAWVDKHPAKIAAEQSIPIRQEGELGPLIEYDKGYIGRTPRGLDFSIAVSEQGRHPRT